jgi:uncharacterized membrane protein YhaH (DUF805 family)
MDWTWYLFRFDGRINRAKYWLAALIILCWMIFPAGLTVAAGLVSGGEVSFDTSDLFRVIDPTSYKSLSWAGLPALLIKMIGTPLFLWVYFASSIKRLHDRDKSGWWMVPFFFIPGLYEQFAERLPDSYFVLPFAVIVFVFCLWGFIEMYCLKGTRWTNRFGPNPPGKDQSRQRSAQTRLRATTAWDQESEIEMVPHKAGPPPVWRVNRGA